MADIPDRSEIEFSRFLECFNVIELCQLQTAIFETRDCLKGFGMMFDYPGKKELQVPKGKQCPFLNMLVDSFLLSFFIGYNS